MTKGEKLIWDLFMKLREVLPATPDNTAWGTEWARVFHEMEHVDAPPAGEVTKAPVAHDDIAEDPELVEVEPPEDPHEHGVPARSVGKRKKR